MLYGALMANFINSQRHTAHFVYTPGGAHFEADCHLPTTATL